MKRDISELLNKIHCCDCLDLMKEMPDKSVDLVLTDPPYGINIGVKTNSGIGIQSKTLFGKTNINKMPEKTDFLLFEDVAPPTQEYFDEMFRISKNQIIFGGNYFVLPPSPCWIVWDKDNGSHDFADCELAWTSFKSAVRKFKYRWNGLLQEDMAHKEKRMHPTQKPLKLMEWCLQKYSKPGDIICDPFMGSGPVIEAAAKRGNPFVGIDKVPEYVAMAQKRLEKVNNHKIDEWF